ncbi:tyrosine-type recombinase/integrase [Vibrio sp. E150_011]
MSELDLQVKTNVFLDGEEYPFLINRASGKPTWYPTLFATTQVRNVAKSASTINQNLQAIRLLLMWADAQRHPVDLKQRFLKKEWLNEAERHSLSNFLATKRPRNKEVEEADDNVVPINRRSEDVRRGRIAKVKSVSTETLAQRLTYVGNYIGWFAKHVQEESGERVSASDLKQIDRMVKSLKKMQKPAKGRNQERKRQGLTEEQRVELLEIIEVGHPRNPFRQKRRVNKEAQTGLEMRNELLIWFGYYLGMRDGEILSVKISDIDGATKTILVARRPDDPNDSRQRKAKTKTHDRRLPLKSVFLEKIYDYITQVRSKIGPATLHDFLFVTHKHGPYYGEPLSMVAVEKMVRQIRAASPILNSDFTMHVLRHDSNDRFSETMDEKEVPAEKEQKMRSYHYGWKPTSNTAKEYTRRHTRKQAHEASLLMQEKLEKRNKGIKE